MELLKEYGKAIAGADNPEAALLILINEAVQCAESARLGPDDVIRRSLINRSRQIVTQLAATLNTDYGGEMAFNLLRLYLFINRRLADTLAGDTDGLTDALRILRHVQEVWTEAVELANSPLTDNQLSAGSEG